MPITKNVIYNTLLLAFTAAGLICWWNVGITVWWVIAAAVNILFLLAVMIDQFEQIVDTCSDLVLYIIMGLVIVWILINVAGIATWSAMNLPG